MRIKGRHSGKRMNAMRFEVLALCLFTAGGVSPSFAADKMTSVDATALLPTPPRACKPSAQPGGSTMAMVVGASGRERVETRQAPPLVDIQWLDLDGDGYCDFIASTCQAGEEMARESATSVVGYVRWNHQAWAPAYQNGTQICDGSRQHFYFSKQGGLRYAITYVFQDGSLSIKRYRWAQAKDRQWYEELAYRGAYDPGNPPGIEGLIDLHLDRVFSDAEHNARQCRDGGSAWADSIVRFIPAPGADDPGQRRVRLARALERAAHWERQCKS